MWLFCDYEKFICCVLLNFLASTKKLGTCFFCSGVICIEMTAFALVLNSTFPYPPSKKQS